MAVPIDRSLRLPASQYVPGARRKSGIAIHHTVGGSARDTYELWCADGRAGRTPRLVGTAYIVDRDGTLAVAALQDSILQLQTAATRAYETGFQAAHAGYQAISGRYVAELRKPRIRLGSTLRLLGAAGAGILIGRATR